MSINHPVFSRFYQRFAAVMERRGADAHRRRLLADLQGDVIEVGAGHGPNFPHYPPEVAGVLAVEPERHLRQAAQQAVATAPVPVKVDRFRFPDSRLVLPTSPHALGRAKIPAQT